MLDFKFFSTVGVEVVNRYRKHIFDEGKDIDGIKFKPYLNEQEPNSYGKRKRAKKFKRQANAFANTTSPVLTGDLYRDFKLIGMPNDKGFSFGTVSHGGKVEALKKLGRNLYRGNKVLPTPVVKYFEKEMKKYGDKQLKKNKGKGGTFNI